jgi:hypothetical protein
MAAEGRFPQELPSPAGRLLPLTTIRILGSTSSYSDFLIESSSAVEDHKEAAMNAHPAMYLPYMFSAAGTIIENKRCSLRGLFVVTGIISLS